MAQHDHKKWRKEFGLDDRTAPNFVSSREELDAAPAAVAQAHVIRRAFERLKLDGVLCIDNAPVIYFRSSEQLDASSEAELLKLFWNQGVAPILAVIDTKSVRIYSGLVAPDGGKNTDGSVPNAVETLSRAGSTLHSFIRSVETGDFFKKHSRSFDPTRRVDRELLRNLQSARTRLSAADGGSLDTHIVDALLCRLVFTCYLFDRGVIARKYLSDCGIDDAEHLTDILSSTSGSDAKADLYRLFEQLSEDFNGDLFADDLDSERTQVTAEHIEIVNGFFRGQRGSGQLALWGYDFSVIPIETISAIYEHFLKAADPVEKHRMGAFYTPRFLAEFVIDRALTGYDALLDKRFLDPACGSGIFLVGLFNRLAEEWRRKNSDAKYDRTASGLIRILRENLFGVDRNFTACRITAFSLYLALLDQLSPPDIRQLQRKGKFLPRLVASPDGDGEPPSEHRTIRCTDFFSAELEQAVTVHCIVGNPPWASIANKQAPAAVWCKDRGLPFPDRQIANAFMWKAPKHLLGNGRVCFVLPHAILFAHSNQAVKFQRQFFREHAVDLIINLSDYQFFLFDKSRHPALVMRFGNEAPPSAAHRIDFMAPKADWSATRAEIITVLPEDRSRLTVGEILDDLNGIDAPLIWKRRTWASPRDWQLLDRLLLMPRLRDVVGQPLKPDGKPWLAAVGFQPFHKNDSIQSRRVLRLPTKTFIEAASPCLQLVLRREECSQLPSRDIEVRRLIRDTSIFNGPHVLVSEGYSSIAFADFDVSFQHALRGIHGPKEDSDRLKFLAAYLRSALARYFLFHTSSNWGVSRSKVHLEELLRVPFVLPEFARNPKRSAQIVTEVAKAVTRASEKLDAGLTNKVDVVRRTQEYVEPLINEYFDIDAVEASLIADTAGIIVPSIRPTREMNDVRTVTVAGRQMLDAYERTLCATLNEWADKKYTVHCRVSTSEDDGMAVAALERTARGQKPTGLNVSVEKMFQIVAEVQQKASLAGGSFEVMRGVKLFQRNRLFFFKPRGQRFWSQTAAFNDADEIAAGLLLRSLSENA